MGYYLLLLGVACVLCSLSFFVGVVIGHKLGLVCECPKETGVLADADLPDERWSYRDSGFGE